MTKSTNANPRYIRSAVESSTGSRKTICCECGNVRTTKSRNYADHTLKCSVCRRPTRHAQVLPAGVSDWREQTNLHEDAAVVTELASILALFDQAKVEILFRPSGELWGGACEVVQFLDEPAFYVRVANDASDARLVELLRWAWKSLLPCTGMTKAQIFEDSRGRWRGVYNNE